MNEPVFTDDYVYTLTLADGTKIGNLRKSADVYVSKEPIDQSIMEYNMSPTIISNGQWEEKHEHMSNPIVSHVDGYYYLSIWDVPKAEIRFAKLRSDIDYLAMAADVEM